MMLFGSEVETSFPAFAVAGFIALPLHEQFMKRHIAAGKNAEVAVERHHPFICKQGKRSTNSNRFLTDAADTICLFCLAAAAQASFLQSAGEAVNFYKNE